MMPSARSYDDQAMVHGSFRVLADHTPGMTAAGEAADGAEAVELARRERPDTVLLDVRMPKPNGIEATRQTCSAPALAGVRVLILTTFGLDEYVYAALRAGAAGFLLKDNPADRRPHRHRGCHRGGEALLAPSVTRRLIAGFARRPEPTRPPSSSLDAMTNASRKCSV
ncbi:response regulator transcription factor [Streptomyces sp. DT2A-34]|uniref:response regulator n=1 Tax=Streptomyces sp. DT2A-34 TaxID=3051182 RepID=UPI00265BCF41|nr:response regulator transcription factor [Streptomyces sp. DT2A-34]MDO0914120.1 response regulator transcription factor [Streptomyces sp. DT2A-34]